MDGGRDYADQAICGAIVESGWGGVGNELLFEVAPGLDRKKGVCCRWWEFLLGILC
jgi:hypothetical protein